MLPLLGQGPLQHLSSGLGWTEPPTNGLSGRTHDAGRGALATLILWGPLKRPPRLSPEGVGRKRSAQAGPRTCTEVRREPGTSCNGPGWTRTALLNGDFLVLRWHRGRHQASASDHVRGVRALSSSPAEGRYKGQVRCSFYAPRSKPHLRGVPCSPSGPMPRRRQWEATCRATDRTRKCSLAGTRLRLPVTSGNPADRSGPQLGRAYRRSQPPSFQSGVRFQV
jgi:hypothetical protein